MGTQDDLTFDEWLRDELDRHNMRQQDLADAIGADQSTVSSWVNGQSTPQPRNCRAIARVFGVDQYEVLRRAGRRGVPPRQPPASFERSRGGIVEGDPSTRLWTEHMAGLEAKVDKALQLIERLVEDREREDDHK